MVVKILYSALTLVLRKLSITGMKKRAVKNPRGVREKDAHSLRRLDTVPVSKLHHQ